MITRHIVAFSLLGLASACGEGKDFADNEETESSDGSSSSDDDSSEVETTSDDEESSQTSDDSSASTDSESHSSSDEDSSSSAESSGTDSQSDESSESQSSDEEGSSSDDEDVTGTIDGEVVRYDLHFSLKNLELATVLGVHADEPGGDCFVASCEPDVTEATWNGADALSSDADGEKFEVCGDSVQGGDELRIGAKTTVEERTYLKDPQGTTLDVGFTKKANLSGKTTAYLMSWIGGCKHFAPCDADPARLAEFHYEIEHEAGAVVLCPGKLTAGSTTTTCDIDASQGMALAPTYTGFMVAADSDWQRSSLASAAGVDLVIYEGSGGKIKAALDQAQVAKFFEWITDLIGDYPYGNELRFAGGPTVWLGLEHPANIILQEKLPDVSGAFADTTMHVLMHETAHQWSGNRTTLASAQDFAWKESTAEYLTYLFEEAHGKAGEAARTREFWEQLALSAKHYPRPLDTPELEPQEFYGDAYGAGPLVMYIQLEDLLGRDAVVEAMQNFLADPGARSVGDLRDELEKASGEELDDYFDAWVFGAGVPAWPTFTVSTQPVAGGIEVQVVQQTDDNVLRGCVVEVEIETSGGTERVKVDFGVKPASDTAKATASLSGAVIKTRVDPDHRVIDKGATFPAPLLDAWRWVGY
jgi:aminopeptidase N